MPLDIALEPAIITDLLAGRDYIERHGWCRGQSRNGQQVCILGGIYAVTGGQSSVGIVVGQDLRREAACNALQLALNEKLGTDSSSLAWWNDDDKRTIDEVFEIYDLAIMRERIK